MDCEKVVFKTEDHLVVEMSKASQVRDLPTLAPSLSCGRICAFSNQDTHLLESIERSKVSKKLSGLVALYVVFMAIEIFGGLKSNSLAILTDAAHLLSDVAGVSISLFSVRASSWKATPRQSYGFNRLEVLGALASVQLIWMISGVLIYESTIRILHQQTKVNGGLMFGIAAFGFLINVIMATWLGHNHSHHGCGHLSDAEHDHHHHDHKHHHHQDHEKSCGTTEEEEAHLIPNSLGSIKALNLNINIQGAYLHVIADLIQSVGVMIAGAIIWARPDWLIIDLVCTIVFSVFALSATINLLRSIFGILMEGTPDDINVTKLEDDLRGTKGVQEIHDLHVWALTTGKNVLSCHVRADPEISQRELLTTMRKRCVETYRIDHVTIQIE
uniref:Uncharacterized protein n=1 Tax=Kalanchoe fedtschenkoi TaxID=63787 RepID=A0A7N1A1R4_KALFE